ncbi:MAG: pantoate--beta-alanine ligase [Pseudomonadota bacterium]
METVTAIAPLRALTGSWRAAGERIAFVPTMGNLHAGHLALVARARAGADRVVVSVFVNPMQFGPQEDLASYPVTLAADEAALRQAGADLLFLPAVADIYPDGIERSSRVVVPGLNAILEGAHRPTHFDGVSTVVTKLFNLVQPDSAVFGEKDYQQLLLIRRMVADLCLPIRIDSLPTVREPDGLAMSSRNSYLDRVERGLAPQLYQTLLDVQSVVTAGERDFAGLERAAAGQLREAGFSPDYVSIRRAADLAEPGQADRVLIVLAAAALGRARLIDNLRITIQ